MVVLLTAVAYDRNLEIGHPNGVRAGVVSASGNEASASAARELVDAIRSRITMKVKGLPLYVEAIEASAATGLGQQLAERGVNLLFLAPGLDGTIVAALQQYAKQQRCLMVSNDSAYLGSGLAIAVVLNGDRPKLVIDLEAAQEQGADFPGTLLQLAELRR
ncbi:MAG: YfiR family protein [Myxococcota bacterium]